MMQLRRLGVTVNAARNRVLVRPATATALNGSRLVAPTPVAMTVSGVRSLVTGDTPKIAAIRSAPLDPKTGKFIALGRLKTAPSARTKFRMIGRGEGSHMGKSAGRGMRGTYHRRALRKRNFEGGQTPLHRRIPKRGHHIPPMFQERFTDVPIGHLQYLVETGRLDATLPIQIKDLVRCGIKPKKDGIRLVGSGAHRLTFPLSVEVSRIDELAKYAIEEQKGSVKLVYFSRLGMRAHLYPERFDILPAATNIPKPKKRYIYMPYRQEPADALGGNPPIPPLLFKSRIMINSPLAKYWTPSPLATKYFHVQNQIDLMKRRKAAGTGSGSSGGAGSPSSVKPKVQARTAAPAS